MPNPPTALFELDITQERELAVWLLSFFSPLNSPTIKDSNGTRTVPHTLGAASREVRQVPDLSFAAEFVHLPLVLHELIQRLIAANFMHTAGTGKGSPPLNAYYYSSVTLTRSQKRGDAWLTEALGWEHLLRVASPSICQILGKNKAGDLRSGTGLLLSPSFVVTNAHVVNDMTPEFAIVGDREHRCEPPRAHCQA